MFRKSVIFLGPSASEKKLRYNFPDIDMTFLSSVKDVPIKEDDHGLFIVPPIVNGNLLYLSQAIPSATIGIIDGFFENTPSVWHKEILYSLSRNMTIYGAASMGALRASELQDYGMIGIGQIYQRFKNGIYEDDDEVAVIHGPKELEYASISDAMVNIRATLELALSENIISSKVYEEIILLSKSLFYKDRKWDYILSQYQIKNPKILDHSFFRNWVSINHVDQKLFDAIELVNTLIHDDKKRLVESNYYSFQDSSIWRKFIYA